MLTSDSSVGDGLIEAEPKEQATAFYILFPLVEEIPVHADAPQINRGRRLISRGFILAVVAVLAYLPCFWAGLLDEEADRLRHLTRPEVRLGNLHQLASWFEFGSRVPQLLRILIYVQHGPEGSAPLWQICGVGLHATTVVLLWLVMRRLSQPAAWLAALLFAVHPVNLSAVAWVSEQARLWGGMFSILGSLLLLINRDVPGDSDSEQIDYFAEANPWMIAGKGFFTYSAAAVAFLLAMLCQPTTAVVPVVATLLIVWKRTLRRMDYILLSPMLMGGLFVSSVLLRHWKHIEPVNGLIAPIGRVFADLLMLHSSRSPWVDAGPVLRATATCLGVVFLCALPLLILLRHRVENGVWIAAAAVVLLFPTITAPAAVHVSDVSLTSFLDRSVGYLCAIPMLVLAANLILKLSLRSKDELTQVLVQLLSGMAIGGALAAFTFVTVRTHGSTEILLKSMVTTDVQPLAAKSRLAEYYLHQGSEAGIKLADVQLAGVGLESCTVASTAVAAGDLAQARGQLLEAERWYQRGKSLEHQESGPDIRLAALYVRENRTGEALNSYQQAIQKHSEDPELRNAYALLLGATGQSDAELKQFQKALEIDPEYVPAHVNLASAYIRHGEIEQGALELQTAVSLDPDNYDAFHNAGEVLAEKHEFERSIRMLTTAVQLRPESAEARNDLGVAFVGANKLNQAIFEFQEALRLSPSYESARHNLQVAQLRLAKVQTEQPLSPVR